eukprot:17326-Heterococcus_DN1.PRE.3
MSNKRDPLAVQQALKCWSDVLVAEEQRIESGVARETMSNAGVTVVARVRGDQDAESSAVGGVLQLHLPAIQRLLFHSTTGVRANALSILGVLTRQGLLDPLSITPHLIALQADANAAVRAEALKQLVFEDEKKHDYITKRFIEGLVLSYLWSVDSANSIGIINISTIALLPTDEQLARDRGAVSPYAPLYIACIRQAREKPDKRRLILKLMLNLFDPKKSHAVWTHLQTAKAKLQSSTTADIDDVTSTTSNCDIKSMKTSSSVATVSSNGTSPSRSVQRHTSSGTNRRRSLSTNGASQKDQQYITKLVDLNSVDCLSAMKTALKQAGHTVTDDNSDDDEDMNVSSNGDTTSNATQQQLLQVLAYNDSIAKAMCMLVKLKEYLKKIYSLKDKTCYSYNPSDKADIRSTAITPVRPFELSAPPSKSSKSQSGNSSGGALKAYAEQYEQLKHRLDNDASESMYNNSSSSSATKQTEDDDTTDDIQR